MKTVTIPEQLTEPMMKAWIEAKKKTPYIHRRKMDKSGYEIVRQDNTDWREVIDDPITVIAEYPTSEEAEHHYDRLVIQWIWSAVINKA
jgi:hypothetical protein